MSTPLIYTRSFSKDRARRGQIVFVYIKVSFIAPISPSVNCWFNNVADNLGGSNVNGPLVGIGAHFTTTNLIPDTQQWSLTGNGTNNGCFRTWINGASYPGLNSPLSSIWRPINPGMLCELSVSITFQVDNAATIGTIFDPAIHVTPTDNNNFTPNRMMIDYGSAFSTLYINPNPPPGAYRTLTIIP